MWPQALNLGMRGREERLNERNTEDVDLGKTMCKCMCDCLLQDFYTKITEELNFVVGKIIWTLLTLPRNHYI